MHIRKFFVDAVYAIMNGMLVLINCSKEQDVLNVTKGIKHLFQSKRYFIILDRYTLIQLIDIAEKINALNWMFIFHR